MSTPGWQARPSTIALVPVNALAAVKTRLRGVLADQDRRALVMWLARRVVGALEQSRVVARIVVVSPDPDALAHFASDRSVLPLVSTAGELNADLEQARHRAVAEGAQRLLVALADLPLLDGGAVRGMLAVLESIREDGGPAAVLAPDRAERGTNAMLIEPADALPFAFGEASLDRHIALARHAGIEPVIYRSNETRFDVDTPADLRELVARELWVPRADLTPYPLP